jgi:hypothetical protein
VVEFDGRKMCIYEYSFMKSKHSCLNKLLDWTIEIKGILTQKMIVVFYKRLTLLTELNACIHY